MDALELPPVKQVPSSKGIRKASMTRFEIDENNRKEKEQEELKHHDTTCCAATSLPFLRKSKRTPKKPKRAGEDDDDDNNTNNNSAHDSNGTGVQKSRSFTVVHRKRKRKTAPTAADTKAASAAAAAAKRKNDPSRNKKCTTKSGIKYVLKPKANTMQHDIDWDNTSIDIQTVTAPTILKASKKLYRPSKSEQNSLFQIPSPTHRANIYLRAAKAMAYQEAKALPSHGGRMWTCIVTIQDPQGAYATSQGVTQVLPKSCCPKGKGTALKSPLFLWNKTLSSSSHLNANNNTWTLQLAALPNLMNQIDVIDIQHGLLKSVQQSDMTSSQSFKTGGGSGKQHPVEEHEILPPISILSTVAHQDANHSLPIIDRKWISPDLISFKTRTSAIQHSLELMERDKLIDKVIHGIGNRGGYLKPRKVSKSVALQAGYYRFLRDGIWVIGQEEERILEQYAIDHEEKNEYDDNEDGRVFEKKDVKDNTNVQNPNPDCEEECKKISSTIKVEENRRNAIETNIESKTSSSSSHHHLLLLLENSIQIGIETILEPQGVALDDVRNQLNTNKEGDDIESAISVGNQDNDDVMNETAPDAVDTLQSHRNLTLKELDRANTNVNGHSNVTAEDLSQTKSIFNEDSYLISCQNNAQSRFITEPYTDFSIENSHSKHVLTVQDVEASSRIYDEMSMTPSVPERSQFISDTIKSQAFDDSPVGNKYDDNTNVASMETNKKQRMVKRLVPSTDFRLTNEQITRCYNAVIQHYERVMYTVKAKALFSELADGFDVFRERGTGRYDMTIKEFDSPDFSFLTDEKSAAWMPVVKKILGEDATLVHKGAFLSMPDSSTQVYHQDGVHLTTKYQKPCHAINVFIPLVDLTMKNGPTEFCIGSHYLGHEHFQKDMVYTPTPKAGCPLIFDYRLGHRGLGNSSLEPRPLVYLTYTRASKEFRDSVNFSSKSYHKLGEIIEKPLSRKERALKRVRDEPDK